MTLLRALAAVALAIAILLVAAFPLDWPAAKAPARDSSARAKSALLRALAVKLPRERRVRCRRVGRPKRRTTRYRCAWRATRRLTPNRARVCRGRGKVHRRDGRFRARVTRRRCRLRVAALAPRFGFHDNSVTGGRASPEQIARLVESTGAGLYRTLIDWRSAEPAQNRYDWSLADSIYAAMTKRGIRPVFIIAWAPPWAWDPAVKCAHPHCHFPPGPAFDREWREFAALLAARYPKLAAIEIWNEANESTAWNPQPDPERFADLVREASRAIKGVSPSIAVVSGGLSNREQSDNGGLSVADFASRMFLRGVADHIDGIGMHPYAPLAGLDRLERPLDLLRSLTPSKLPIWVTEVGTSTTGGPLGVSEEDQARAAVQTYERFRRDPEVRAILMHTLIDPQPGQVPPEDVGYGVLRGDLSPKPAYCALAKATGARSRCP